MKLIIGGVRGTNPVSQPEFMKYGGETTSFLIEGARGERILVDAGTGIRVLGDRIDAGAETSEVLLLMTHYHLDHVVGLPSLGLIYQERWSILMAAPDHGSFRVDEIMPQILAKPFWPLQVEHLESNIHFRRLAGEIPDVPMEHGGLRIRWCPVHHPGGCTAYRIDEPSTGESIVVATDVEWGESSPAEKQHLLDLCARPTPASVLIMDGHCTPEEYPKYKGWGHGTWKDACDVAKEAGCQRLLVTHHGPYNDDARLLEIEKQVWKYLSIASLARERTVISLDGDEDRPTQPFTSRGGGRIE